MSHFNPRSPRGERRELAEHIVRYRAISIHAPREGSDLQLHVIDYIMNISIHAPREGSDAAYLLFATVAVNFNPRSPRGERLFFLMG